MLDRAGAWWNVHLSDPEHAREGASALRAAVIDGAAYALYAPKPDWDDGRPAGEVRVRELVAATPEGNAAIWGFLLGLDLIRRVMYELAPSDDPLPHMLTEGRAVRQSPREKTVEGPVE